jgi:RND family efflux transporter MFP subunit
MIVVLLNAYLLLLGLFVWLKIVPFNLFWKVSPVVVLLGLLAGLFIPMGWGAPSGPAMVLRNSVQIVPSVSGEVVDVSVQANVPVKEGEVLFRIDPTTYDSQARAIEAQLKFAELRLAQFSELQRREAGRGFDVQQHQAQADQLAAQLEGARWNLEKTTVRAPANGYVTNLTLRKGARVTAQSPVMAFIDTSDILFGAEIPQIYTRYIVQGQPAEITFKILPGRIYSGRVETVIQAISTGQAPTTGLAVTPQQIETAPFIVRVRLDDKDVVPNLPAGATALVAVFTDHVKASHVIRKVLLRQTAILNYVNPF